MISITDSLLITILTICGSPASVVWMNTSTLHMEVISLEGENEMTYVRSLIKKNPEVKLELTDKTNKKFCS